MLFFLDTADIQEIETGLEWGMVDGVTTNPSLIAKQGKPYLPTVREVAQLVPGPVSGEVLATDYEGMLDQGRRLAALADNVVVKLPLGPPGLRAVRTLAAEGIKSNVTLCFSAAQALLAGKAGAAYISPFIGRLDDVGQDGMQLIQEVVEIYDHYDFETQVLVASVASPHARRTVRGARRRRRDVAFQSAREALRASVDRQWPGALSRRLGEDWQELRRLTTDD